MGGAITTFAGVDDNGLSGSHSMPGGTATCRHGNQTLTHTLVHKCVASWVQMSPSSVSTVRILAGSRKILVFALPIFSSTLVGSIWNKSQSEMKKGKIDTICKVWEVLSAEKSLFIAHVSFESVSSGKGSSSISCGCSDEPAPTGGAVSPTFGFFCSSRVCLPCSEPPATSLRRFLALELVFSGSSSNTSKSSSENRAMPSRSPRPYPRVVNSRKSPHPPAD